MKERIVIEDEQIVRQARNTILVGYPLEFEQVPETFEELLELCANLEKKNVFIINAGICIEFNGLYFWKDGSITITENNNDIWATKTKVTPAQMWQIIKNLVEEK